MKTNLWRSSVSFALIALGLALIAALGTVRGFGVLPGAESNGSAGTVFGGGDINLITGPDPFPRVTQTESTSWGHGNTVVVAYTDSSGLGFNPPSKCGVSVSTDGGASFVRLPHRFNEIGPCHGGAAVHYSARSAKWHLYFLTDRCGSKGVGQWVSQDGINWTIQGCAANGSPVGGLANPTSWVDNNPGSGLYGRQYVSFNDLSNNTIAPRLVVSLNDNGQTWGPSLAPVNAPQRALKVFGSLGTDGAVFVQTLDEGGGGLNGLRRNFIYRLNSDGATFLSGVQQAPPFLGPGRSVEAGGYFAGIYSTPVAGYWQDMGWGQPGMGPDGVVHYVYAASTSSDPGNIYYVRSNNSGQTWSPPVQLNTDSTSRAQWSPSLSVNAQGRVFVSWYDERNTTGQSLQRFGRASLNNGATWENDIPVSDVIFPKPLQPDPGIGPTFVGWHHHAAFSEDGYGSVAYHAWTDGRNLIGGDAQQDVFFKKIVFTPVTFTVTTTDEHSDGICSAADCSLWDAINAANATSYSFVTFAPGVTGTITTALQNTGINLLRPVTIIGPGARQLTISGSGTGRIFNIADAAGVVRISGLTLANGKPPGTSFPAGHGGAVLNAAWLALSDCALKGNAANVHGGAIFNNGISGSASLLLNKCTLSGNTADLSGGAIFTAAYSGRTTLELTNSTLHQNTAGQFGGAIYNDGTSNGIAMLTVTNCTFHLNSASLGGGGMVNDGLNPSTSGFARITLGSTLLRTGNAGANLLNDGGSILSQGRNLSSDNGGGFLTGTGDQIQTDPRFDPAGLANNGGPTDTVALLPDSTAINTGNDALAPALDQRGYVRAGLSDIGAFEFGGAPLRITSITRLANGHAVLEGVGVRSRLHTIQASPDLSAGSFVTMGSSTANSSGALTFDDAGTEGATKRFYRLAFP